MFLGVTPSVTKWSPAADEFSLMLENNPLAEFVELPAGHDNLYYSNILCGVLRGALEMVCNVVQLYFFYSFTSLVCPLTLVCFLLDWQVQMEVEVHFVQDALRSDDTTEIRVKFIKKLEDAIPAGEE